MHVLDTAWQTLEREFDIACAAAARAAREQITANLNQIFRRLRHYENEEQWIAALRDGVAQHAHAFGIFTVKDGIARLRAAQNLQLDDGYTLPVADASAFSAAVESRDPVVALRAAGEVGRGVAVAECGRTRSPISRCQWIACRSPAARLGGQGCGHERPRVDFRDGFRCARAPGESSLAYPDPAKRKPAPPPRPRRPPRPFPSGPASTRNNGLCTAKRSASRALQ